MDQSYRFHMAILLLILLLVIQPNSAYGSCNCDDSQAKNQDKNGALVYKFVGIGSILIAGGIGIFMPLLLKNTRAFQPETPIHFLIKSFAAGIILATGFLHILPDAFESLTSPCLGENPWGNFPFSGFIAMMAAIFTLIMESIATGYHTRAELQKSQPLDDDMLEDNIASSTSSTGPAILLERSNSSNLIRSRIISQVIIN